MNTRTTILAIVFAATSCGFPSHAQYAESLKKCLTKEDISLLNEACLTFETKLKKYYGGQEYGEAYRAFLYDIQTMNLPPDFFVTADSKEMMERMKNSKTFDKIWIKLSLVDTYDIVEIVPADSQEGKSEYEFDPYFTNPNGEYLGCLMKQNINRTINEYLEAIKSMPGISPGLTARLLQESLTDEDFDNGLTRLVIAIGFYYEMGLMFGEK